MGYYYLERWGYLCSSLNCCWLYYGRFETFREAYERRKYLEDRYGGKFRIEWRKEEEA